MISVNGFYSRELHKALIVQIKCLQFFNSFFLFVRQHVSRDYSRHKMACWRRIYPTLFSLDWDKNTIVPSLCRSLFVSQASCNVSGKCEILKAVTYCAIVGKYWNQFYIAERPTTLRLHVVILRFPHPVSIEHDTNHFCLTAIKRDNSYNMLLTRTCTPHSLSFTWNW